MRAKCEVRSANGVLRHARVVAVLLLMIGATSFATGSLAAQKAVGGPYPPSETATRAIGELRSPYCPGLMLEVCPSGEAEALRDSIRMLAVEGMPAEDIVEWMVASHGEEWRAVPKRSGLGLWAWILPPAVLLFGMGVVITALRSMRRREGDEPGSLHSDLTDEEQAELAAALQEWERSGENNG